MKKKDVPQDRVVLGDQNEVYYAVDDNGRYVMAPSAGWEPANLANLQAWEAIGEELAAILEKIRNHKLSPLAFHMAANQMDAKLLAKNAGLFAWQQRRHMRPGPIRRLQPELKTQPGTNCWLCWVLIMLPICPKNAGTYIVFCILTMNYPD